MPDPDLCTTDAQRAALGRLLSPERLGTYRDAAADACDELDLYLFNMNTASAFLGPLHVLEVVMRNAMHEQLVRSCRQRDWWNSSAVPLSDRHWRWIDLRNRVGHHEPIFDQDLRRASEGVLALVGYVSPDVRARLAARARAIAVVDRRPPVDDRIRWFQAPGHPRPRPRPRSRVAPDLLPTRPRPGAAP